MNEQTRWELYLYEHYSKEEMGRLARSLEYFRYCRAYGGHVDDGDRLLVAIRFGTEQELLEILAQLEIPVTRLPPTNPVPVPGVSYPGTEFAKFIPAVKAFPNIAQPRQVSLRGINVFVWIDAAQIRLEISDPLDRYCVGAEAVHGAQVVEPLLAQLQAKLIEPPLDGKHCVCPKFYPEFWGGRGADA